MPQLGSALALFLGPWESGSFWCYAVCESEEYSQLWYLLHPNSNLRDPQSVIFIVFVQVERYLKYRSLSFTWEETSRHTSYLPSACPPWQMATGSFEEQLKEYSLYTCVMEFQECHWKGTDLLFTECALEYINLELQTGWGGSQFSTKVEGNYIFFFLFI